MAAYLTPYMVIITEIILGSQRELQILILSPILNYAMCCCIPEENESEEDL
jgi:hypothetical protein